MCNVCRTSRTSVDRRVFLRLFAPALIAVAGMMPVRGVHAGAARVQLPAPKPEDTCPVCGMFVAKYTYWVATVLFKDGHADHFDGAKDFFKYLLDMKKYAQGRTREQISAMGVTGYYETVRIDPGEAWFVTGSDVLGPMGHELVPLVDEAEAKEFMADHKGKRVLRFADVSMALVDGLDTGKFE